MTKQCGRSPKGYSESLITKRCGRSWYTHDLKNYYAILEVPVGCSLEEIRQAYRRLVQEHLDDAAVFADLKEAYEVLSTPTRRAEYDQATWGETFEMYAPNGAPAEAGAPAGSRCPMGAEAQCPVLLGQSSSYDKFCPECGYGLAGLSAGRSFGVQGEDSAPRAWLEDRDGGQHPLRPGANSVGREGSDVLVPDKTVSRNHASLNVAEDGIVVVEDLSSTNGTQVNDILLMPHVPRTVVDGDRLRFGSMYLALHLSASKAAPEEAAMPPAQVPVAGDGQEVGAQVADLRPGSGVIYPLPSGITTFGRRAENTVVLTGDLYVSGSHAQIYADGTVFILTDTGSTNGTLLNGERLAINTPVTLDPGDVIVIGGTALRFERLTSSGQVISSEEAAESILPSEAEETKAKEAEIDAAGPEAVPASVAEGKS